MPTGEFDETGVDSIFASLPSQVEWIDRNAVPADPGAGIVGNKAERLGGGRANNLMKIDAHLVSDDLHFVHQTDVDRAVDVLEQLGEFGGASIPYLSTETVLNGVVGYRRRGETPDRGCPLLSTGGRTRIVGSPGGTLPPVECAD